MASIRARIINRLLFLTGVKSFFANPDQVPAKLAKMRGKGPDLPSNKMHKKFNISEEMYDGYRLFTVTAKGDEVSNSKHVLYLHGGGYIMDIASAHWGFIGRLVEATGASVSVPIYPLAPENKAVDLIPAMHRLFSKLGQTHGAENITFMGDSAGAGLSLALAHSVRDAGETMPGRLVLLSPWLDATGTHPDQPEIEKRDKMLAVKGLDLAGKMYAGDLETTDPRVSPLFGSHDKLPPIQVFTGTADILLPDAQRFRDQMADLGTPVDYHEYADMFHVWMLLPFPEGKQAMRQIAAFMQ